MYKHVRPYSFHALIPGISRPRCIVYTKFVCLLGYFLHLGTSLTHVTNRSMIVVIYFFPVGMIYYTLGNLHPKYRSPLKGIQLLNVTDYSLIEKYGIDTILESIVDAVKRLEEVCEMLLAT